MLNTNGHRLNSKKKTSVARSVIRPRINPLISLLSPLLEIIRGRMKWRIRAAVSCADRNSQYLGGGKENKADRGGNKAAEGKGRANGTTYRQRPSEGDIVRIRLLRWRQIALWILCLSIRGILVIKGSGVLRSFLLFHPVSDCCSHPEPSMRFHAAPPRRFMAASSVSIDLSQVVSNASVRQVFF